MFLEQKVISSALAEDMLKAASAKAVELNAKVNIAIVDHGGNLIAFKRMDQAPILSIEIAQNKAYTAAAFGVATHEWYDMIKDNPALREGIVHTNRLTIFGGGYPIMNHGQLTGGIGVSGGSVEEDQACCEAALNLLK